MGTADYIVIAIIVAILGFAGWYVYKSKKSGKRCIGCPDGGSCSGSCGSCSGENSNCCNCGCGGADK